MATDILGNTKMMSVTATEHTDGLMAQYITDSGTRVTIMVQDIRGGQQMAMNIGDSSRITCNREKESNKRMESSSKTNMKQATASAEAKQSEILQFLNIYLYHD